MPDIFEQIAMFEKFAKATGASVAGSFNQSQYMELQGFSQTVRDGCCLAFVSSWLKYDGEFKYHSHYLNNGGTPKLVEDTTLAYYSQKGSGLNLGKLDIGYLSQSFDNFKVKFTGKNGQMEKIGGKSVGSGGDLVRLVKFITEASAGYQMHFQGKGGGHAIGFLHHPGDRLSFYDPNFGQLNFSGAPRLTQFLMLYFPRLYPTLNNDWFCVRAKC